MIADRSADARFFITYTSEAAVMTSPSGFHLKRSAAQFRMHSPGVVETAEANRTKFYPPAQSTAQEYMRLRRSNFRLNPFKP